MAEAKLAGPDANVAAARAAFLATLFGPGAAFYTVASTPAQPLIRRRNVAQPARSAERDSRGAPAKLSLGDDLKRLTGWGGVACVASVPTPRLVGGDGEGRSHPGGVARAGPGGRSQQPSPL